MLKITSVEVQKKNPHRFNIFIDGKFAFGADEDLVVDRRLIVGKEFETHDIEKLLFEAEVGKLMERMYGLFNVRLRSEKEIRDYLKNLSYKRKIKDREEISEASIELLIDKLKQKKLINDLEFAKAWMEARSKKKGKIAIKLELMQKGIDREIIEEVISYQPSDGSEGLVAEKLLSKKLNLWKNLSPVEFKKKSIDYLLRRGFEYELVRNIVEKVLKKE
ncbi:MAG: RecX family transcriptional regulator [Candidatus Daviesbacteria bacterium]|nr:RecX family transcriptional regulator [Candidatus Daviesbacteria bacterium]